MCSHVTHYFVGVVSCLIDWLLVKWHPSQVSIDQHVVCNRPQKPPGGVEVYLPRRWRCARRSSLSWSQIWQMVETLDSLAHTPPSDCTSCFQSSSDDTERERGERGRGHKFKEQKIITFLLLTTSLLFLRGWQLSSFHIFYYTFSSNHYYKCHIYWGMILVIVLLYPFFKMLLLHIHYHIMIWLLCVFKDIEK